MDDTNVDANLVVENLTVRIANLERDNAILTARITMLTNNHLKEETANE